MTSSKSTKRALISSTLAILMCVAMLIGTTFAWFTDTASTAVNKIQAGNLKVDLQMQKPDGTWVSAKGETLEFKKATDAPADEKVLWEPGCTYELPKLRVINMGDLALKYTIEITGINGDAKLNDAIDWTIDGIKLGNTFTSLAVGADSEFTIKGHMQETAGNEYQGLSIDGVGITVFATQDTVESDSYNNQYDKDAGTAHYTLDEFNALTEIPEDVKVAYVDLTGTSLEGGITIGNADIADHYHYGEWNSDVAPEGYPTKVGTDKRASDGAIRYIYSTGKSAINVVLTGSVTGANDTGSFGAGAIKLMVPDATNVVFDKVTFGAGQMAISMWAESHVQSMVVAHHVASVTFDSCIFNGNWLQGGDIGTKELVIKNSTFNKYENTAEPNNSNPIWVQNNNGNVTIEGCTINAVRPIKLWESNGSGTATIKNNTFIMSKCTGDTDDTHKNIGVMFCQGKLNNAEVTGNTVKGDATALICFYNDGANYPTMNKGGTFKLSGNNMLDGALESVLWKTVKEWTPSYVTK